jgi:PAS domain S-box-containing protein
VTRPIPTPPTGLDRRKAAAAVAGKAADRPRRASTRPGLRPRRRWGRALAYGLGWPVLGGALFAAFDAATAALALGAAAATHGLTLQAERRRQAAPLRRLAERVDVLAVNPSARVSFEGPKEFASLISSLAGLSDTCDRLARAADGTGRAPGAGAAPTPAPMLTRSGLFESSPDLFGCGSGVDGHSSSDFSTTDMVNRLDPRLFRWLESSPAEQSFLGWDLRQLREKSFLEIVHPDDLVRVRDQLRAALDRGELHGLILRIRTAQGRPRVIEMNVGARYGPDRAVSHLRCHVTDVTAKVRADRELKLRTRELTQVNEQLRLINRELEELKERYRDLYQNAPAMYFSVGRDGVLLECNDTLLRTLGYPREGLVGRPYKVLLPDDQKARFADRHAGFLAEGRIEVHSQWVKADGGRIDVWVTGTSVRDEEGRVVRSRSVAQDVTARHRLEAELREKNERLACTIEELSRRNREMDEFTYVVSHDLQEPLRTLTAFSDYLLRDHGDRLDAEGREFVGHIVGASRRMRALIRDLLVLSRAGLVTSGFAAVDLDEVLAAVRSDLTELIRSRGAEVQVEGPLPVVWGDRARLGQLFANLVCNGLKYNDDPQPRVAVGALPDAGPDDSGAWVTLTVRDNGIGIEPRFHEKIFEMFRRLHTPEEYDGTGAGLAICSKIARAHGGRVWVESEPGRGSTFFVCLRRPPRVAGPVPVDSPDVKVW